MPTVQVKVDWAGGVCAVTDEHPDNVSTGWPRTTRPKLLDAAPPDAGVAVKVPEYVLAAEGVVTVTVPQLPLLAAQLVGPPTLAPESEVL